MSTKLAWDLKNTGGLTSERPPNRDICSCTSAPNGHVYWNCIVVPGTHGYSNETFFKGDSRVFRTAPSDASYQQGIDTADIGTYFTCELRVIVEALDLYGTILILEQSSTKNGFYGNQLQREAGRVIGRIGRQNFRFRTAKTTIIKFGLHASFVELESAKSALNETYRPPPRSERYGSCSVLATVDHRRGGSGRPRNTNDREDRAIRRVSAPTTSLASIQRHLPPSRHPVPSRETIRRRLTDWLEESRRPLRRLPLTPHHRQCRLDFCRPRAT
ncbi:HTH_Tnp_Tc3_2 domain-containing protein [Trichonephila clavipes]|nr:HTH_Tnp_Tc3_2 domain-containing protein [Trichonephila clavipes]